MDVKINCRPTIIDDSAPQVIGDLQCCNSTEKVVDIRDNTLDYNTKYIVLRIDGGSRTCRQCRGCIKAPLKCYLFSTKLDNRKKIAECVNCVNPNHLIASLDP